WARFGKLEWITARALRRLPEVAPGQRWRVFAETARTDLAEAGGFLVLGALISSALNVLVPAKWFGVLGDQIVLGIVVMAVLAVDPAGLAAAGAGAGGVPDRPTGAGGGLGDPHRGAGAGERGRRQLRGLPGAAGGERGAVAGQRVRQPRGLGHGGHAQRPHGL